MKSTRKHLIAGTMIAGAIFGATNLNAAPADMFNFSSLGSGSEVRANLLNNSVGNLDAFLLELSCGDNPTKTTDAKKTDDKSKEAKCGDSNSKDTKAAPAKAGTMKAEAAKSDSTQAESKTKDGKCGEGKCGTE